MIICQGSVTTNSLLHVLHKRLIYLAKPGWCSPADSANANVPVLFLIRYHLWRFMVLGTPSKRETDKYTQKKTQKYDKICSVSWKMRNKHKPKWLYMRTSCQYLTFSIKIANPNVPEPSRTIKSLRSFPQGTLRSHFSRGKAAPQISTTSQGRWSARLQDLYYGMSNEGWTTMGL